MIIVPEQIGKICPVVGDLTINAPVLRNVLFESTKPYVMAESSGRQQQRRAQIKLNVNANKQISRFISRFSLYRLGMLLGWPGPEDSTCYATIVMSNLPTPVK